MKVTTGVMTNMSSLQGYLDDVSFWELVDIFGEPTERDSADGKSRVGWSIRLADSDEKVNIATIYDWKSDEPINEIRRWNVGGYNTSDFLVLNGYVRDQLELIRKGSAIGSDCQV